MDVPGLRCTGFGGLGFRVPETRDLYSRSLRFRDPGLRKTLGPEFFREISGVSNAPLDLNWFF